MVEICRFTETIYLLAWPLLFRGEIWGMGSTKDHGEKLMQCTISPFVCLSEKFNVLSSSRMNIYNINFHAFLSDMVDLISLEIPKY